MNTEVHLVLGESGEVLVCVASWAWEVNLPFVSSRHYKRS